MPHSDASALYIPLRGARETFGVLAILPDPQNRIFAPEQQQLLEVFAGQTALTIERILSQRTAEETRVHMQTEQMRSSLLSAMSHDLRTPLASITGAASTLRGQGDRLPLETKNELLESISDEAERLSRLVGNLLDMTRFESGAVELRRELYPLEEIVGTVLQRVEPHLEDRAISTDLAENLPPENQPVMVFVDEVLIGQVLWNLLENAAKYTPPGSPLEIAALEEDDARDHRSSRSRPRHSARRRRTHFRKVLPRKIRKASAALDSDFPSAAPSCRRIAGPFEPWRAPAAGLYFGSSLGLK